MNWKNLTLITIFLTFCFLTSCTLQQQPDKSYHIVLKNDKVSLLNHNHIRWNQQIFMDIITIHNDPQSITLQIPIYLKEDLKEQYLSNHTQLLPLWCNLLKTKGYLRPFDPFNPTTTHMIKGYRYTKPAYHDTTVHQVYEEIQAFIKTFIQAENLTSLNIRMEDTFTMRINNYLSKQYKYTLNGITIKYLFATVTKDQIPDRLLKREQSTLSRLVQATIKTISHNEYTKLKKFITLERRLYGRGLHQWVNHTITLDDQTDIELQGLVDQCWYQFTDILPESTYVDSDQRRQETTNYEVINVEKPAFASKQYFYKYQVPLREVKQSGVRKYSYHQPIHFRYPSPSLLNYTKVYLHQIVEARVVCRSDEVGSQNSQATGQKVFKIEQNLLFQRGTANIPNADISKSKIVSITTLVVCIIAVLAIIKNLKKN